MSRITDQNYLRNDQYGTASNLNARIEIHRRFSTNQYGWAKWQFEQIAWRAGSNVIEVGCGPATLWAGNRTRIPADANLYLSDFSVGMIREAKAALADAKQVYFCNLDVQAIPYPDKSFDIALANHMLYHVPDIACGLRELARVLKPGGMLYAATNGANHLRELHYLMHEFEASYDPQQDPFAASFGLENGPEHLRPFFAEVEMRPYIDSLWVTDAELLADYAYSLTIGLFATAARERKQEFIKFIQARMERDGGIAIAKKPGLIIGKTNS